MSDRLLKALLGILAFLVLAWAVASFVSSRSGRPESASFQLAELVARPIDSIVVAGSSDTVRLRQGERWTVNGRDAMPDADEQLEGAFENARVGELVSRNPENHDRLGVTKSAGRRLTVYVGGEAALELIVGDQASGFDQRYARRAGELEVYSLRGSLVNLVSRGMDDWRDKEILSVARDDIQRIEYDYPEMSFALVRDSAAWRLEPAGATAEPGTVSGVLRELANLRAIGFAADSVLGALNWDSVTARVQVLGPEGAELARLSFIEREDVGYYVRRAGSDVVYSLSSFGGEQILKREDDLTGTASAESG